MTSVCPICPACHQPVRETRLGVRLPTLKASIFDAIKAAGDVGISSREIVAALDMSCRPVTVKAHVFQINDLLEKTMWRIVSDGAGGACRWHIVKRRQIQVAA